LIGFNDCLSSSLYEIKAVSAEDGLVLGLADRLRLNPLPYLLALCMASNIGSVATITGNPQNIMIASFSGIPYAQFSLSMLPIALAGLVLCAIIIKIIYRERINIIPLRS
jgi:Na+/H+ antiporter NhaD/arsenite permease-like protein